MDEYSPDFVAPNHTPFVPMRSRGELPHLYKEGGSYFVTFRLLDAVALGNRPVKEKSPQNMIAAEIALVSEPPLQLGSCILRRPEAASLVQDALLFFHGKRYNLAGWCVMPNHVHAVFSALLGHTPTDILHSWKSFTAHKLNAMLGNQGPLWERESFDHLIRSLEHFEGFMLYVEQNPVVAGLCKKAEEWPYSHCGAGVSPALGATLRRA